MIKNPDNKNAAAVRLGRLNKGVKKTLSEAERARRAENGRAMMQKINDAKRANVEIAAALTIQNAANQN